MSSLIQRLTACETLLRSIEETFWADKIRAVLIRGNQVADIDLAVKVISWFGGMGSFNDLIISVHNNHVLNGRNEKKLNDDLDKLRSEIYREAVHLKKSI